MLYYCWTSFLFGRLIAVPPPLSHRTKKKFDTFTQPKEWEVHPCPPSTIPFVHMYYIVYKYRTSWNRITEWIGRSVWCHTAKANFVATSVAAGTASYPNTLEIPVYAHASESSCFIWVRHAAEYILLRGRGGMLCNHMYKLEKFPIGLLSFASV